MVWVPLRVRPTWRGTGEGKLPFQRISLHAHGTKPLALGATLGGVGTVQRGVQSTPSSEVLLCAS